MKAYLEKFSILALSLMLVSTFSPSAALPAMISDLARQGVSASQVEFLFSLSSFAILAMLIITPWLGRFLSERVMIVMGLLLVALGGSLPVLFSTYSLVFLSRVILGVGLGLINARAISIISENYKGAERVQMLGIRGSFEVLGNAVLTALCGFLLLFGWQSAFSIYLFALPILAVYLLFAPKSASRENRVQPSKTSSRLTGSQLLMIIGFGAIAGFVININSANSLRVPVLVVDSSLGTAGQASLILSVMMLMGIVAGLLFGVLNKVFGSYLLPVSLLVMAASLFVMSWASNLWWLALGAMLSGFAYSIVVTLAFSLTSEKLPAKLISTATTLILVFCILGGGTASFVLSLFSQINPDKTAAFIIYAIISLVLAALLFAKNFLKKKA